MKVSVTQSCLTLCDLWTIAYQDPRPWDSPGKNTGEGCRFLLQGIFPTQGLNPGLQHCKQTLYHLSHQRNNTVVDFYFIIIILKFYFRSMPPAVEAQSPNNQTAREVLVDL